MAVGGVGSRMIKGDDVSRRTVGKGGVDGWMIRGRVDVGFVVWGQNGEKGRLCLFRSLRVKLWFKKTVSYRAFVLLYWSYISTTILF